jgi:GTPase SAR1 family protein
MRACPACGTESDDTSPFCASCGEFLDWDTSSGPVVRDHPMRSSEFSAAARDAAPTPPADVPPPTQPPRETAPAPEQPAVAVAPAPPLEAAPEEPPPEEPPQPDPVADQRVRRLVARSRALPTATPPVEAPAPAAPRVRPAPRPEPARPPDSGIAVAPQALASVIQIAERGGRTDLASRLKASQEQIRQTGVTVAIVGEFKKGKSSLVNALVNAEVCPADPLFATVAPIGVSHGEALTVTVSRRRGQEKSAAVLAEVSSLASEDGNEGNRLGITAVDITIPRRLLAAGLSLLDTPGIGGLDSAVGALTLTTLETAGGVLFTTDCSQELTAPEMEYLRAARQRCAQILLVMTKLDLYPHAREVVERNRGHLAAAGFDDVEIFPVSSVLHLLALAQNDTRVEEESGFADLFRALHERIWEPARRQGLAAAGQQIAEVADHLAIPIEAERQARGSAAAADRVIGRLAEIRGRVEQFRATNARWQQRLVEGMQDVANDVDFDLRTRMRQVSRLADGRIDSDAAGNDLMYETWLHKVTIEEVIGHYESIVDRTAALADEIGDRFATFDRNAGFRVERAAPVELLDAVQVSRDQVPTNDSVIRRLITTGQGYSSGMVLGSSLLGLVAPALLWLPVITIPFAGYMARKAFLDDRNRRRLSRRQELKRLTSRYLDEIGFVVHKDSRDTLRQLQRQIRDHYNQRAEQFERTLQQAMAAAEQARSEAGTAADGQRLDGDAGLVQQVRGAADRLIAVAPIAS